MSEKTVPIALPEELWKKVRSRIEGSSFASVDDFVAFVLARLVEGTPALGEPFSAEDEAKVKARLKSLGYID